MSNERPLRSFPTRFVFVATAEEHNQEQRDLLNDPTWAAVAAKFAVDAHTNYFHSRFGIWYFEDCDVLVAYHNPYTNDPDDAADTAIFNCAP